MESQLGADFPDARLHTGGTARTSATKAAPAPTPRAATWCSEPAVGTGHPGARTHPRHSAVA
ncbi:hypothetical protein [Kitasatospora sp. NPDC017646]|uniref:hypothetical protein n=1 Tax=Kitasatospora sp. NPDC017646 TaxID=3364024 RepID=UPI0037A99334